MRSRNVDACAVPLILCLCKLEFCASVLYKNKTVEFDIMVFIFYLKCRSYLTWLKIELAILYFCVVLIAHVCLHSPAHKEKA